MIDQATLELTEITPVSASLPSDRIKRMCHYSCLAYDLKEFSSFLVEGEGGLFVLATWLAYTRNNQTETVFI